MACRLGENQFVRSGSRVFYCFSFTVGAKQMVHIDGQVRRNLLVLTYICIYVKENKNNLNLCQCSQKQVSCEFHKYISFQGSIVVYNNVPISMHLFQFVTIFLRPTFFLVLMGCFPVDGWRRAIFAFLHVGSFVFRKNPQARFSFVLWI